MREYKVVQLCGDPMGLSILLHSYKTVREP